MRKRVLFFYLTLGSGHHAAAKAIIEALGQLDPSVETKALDAFSYSNPTLAKWVLRTYLGIIRTAPEVWDYLYDNQQVMKRIARVRDRFNNRTSERLRKLIESYKPDCVVCTQAFSCNVVAHYKEKYAVNLPLVGVLTDFVAHRYWGNPQTDLYIAPTRDTAISLLAQGVPRERIRDYGIPIKPAFAKEFDKTKLIRALGLVPAVPKVVVMGGSRGLGPMKQIVNKLDRIPKPFELIVICSLNRKLFKQLKQRVSRLRHPMKVYGFVNNMPEWLTVADILVTKPGGLTTAEALVKRTPMVICNPIPGQEEKNTQFLLANGVAVRADQPRELARVVHGLLEDPEQLERMRRSASGLSKPDAATDTAREILNLIRSTAGTDGRILDFRRTS
jgi:processive 1,2-diacylglycerol beta-glucosyltransferase